MGADWVPMAAKRPHGEPSETVESEPMLTVSDPPASAPWWSDYSTIRHIRILHVDLTPDDNREAEAAQWLDADEQTRMNRFKVPRPRTQYVLCRSALRAFLCKTLGCGNSELTFGYGEFGKPFCNRLRQA